MDNKKFKTLVWSERGPNHNQNKKFLQKFAFFDNALPNGIWSPSLC